MSTPSGHIAQPASPLVSIRGWAGRPAILCGNGPSLLDHSFARIGVNVIGVNRSWERVWPTIHVAAEQDQHEKYPGVYAELNRQGRLVVPTGWPFGIKMKILPAEEEFSLDATRGAVLGVQNCGSTAYFAFQLATWLGAKPIYLVGMDCGERDGVGHFHGGRCNEGTGERQDRLLWSLAERYAPGRAYFVGHTHGKAFPRLPTLPAEVYA